MASPSIHDIWVAEQMTRRIISDNKKIKKYDHYLGSNLWNLVCGYWCEEPSIVNIIAHIDMLSYRYFDIEIKLKCLLPYQDHFFTHLLTLSISGDYHKGYKIYEILLLLPEFINGIECGTQDSFQGVYEMRVLLYDKLINQKHS